MAGADIMETLKKAKALFDRGQLLEAKALVERTLAETPKDTKSLNFLAYLQYKLGDLPSARDVYRRLTGLEPDNLSVWSNLGLVALKMGLYEDARLAFEEYLSRKPDDPKVREYLALALKKVGRPAAAHKVVAQARAGQEAAESAPPPTEQPPPIPPAPPAPAEEAAPAPAAGRRPQEERAAPAEEAVSLSEWVGFFETREAPSALPYRTLSSRLVSIRLENRVVFALPALTMYQGITLFEQGPNPYGKIPRPYRSDDLILLSAEGNGGIWLTHDAGGLVILGLENEGLVLNAHHLAAFDAVLECEWLPLGKERFLPGLAALRFSGRGRVVLAAGDGPASTPVRQGASLYLRPSSVLAWTDGLRAEADGGEDLKKVKGFFDSPFVRFEGMGLVFVTGGTGR